MAIPCCNRRFQPNFNSRLYPRTRLSSRPGLLRIVGSWPRLAISVALPEKSTTLCARHGVLTHVSSEQRRRQGAVHLLRWRYCVYSAALAGATAERGLDALVHRSSGLGRKPPHFTRLLLECIGEV